MRQDTLLSPREQSPESRPRGDKRRKNGFPREKMEYLFKRKFL